jgi:sigma-B regulation protein RsbU (phosphoserine phosphatase)
VTTAYVPTERLVRQDATGSLGRTLVLRLTLATGAVLLALGVALDAVGRSTIAGLGMDRERARIAHAAGVLDVRLASIGRDAATLAGSCAARPTIDRETVLHLLTFLADGCGAFDALVLRPDGDLIPRKGWKPPSGYDPLVRPWYKAATGSGGKPYAITAPYTGAVSGELLITVAAAAGSGPARPTVVAIDLAVPRLLDDVRALNRDARTVRAVDADGRWILHEDAGQLLGGRIDGAPEGGLWRRFQQSRTMVSDHLEDRYALIAPVGEAGWALVVDLPTAAIDGAAWRVTGLFAAGTGLALAVLALAVWLTSRSIILPVRRLAALAQRVRSGDLEARADDSRDDELGLLARRFNELIAAMHERDSMRGRLAEAQSAQARLEGQLTLANDLRRAVRPADTPRVAGAELAVRRIGGRLGTGSFHDLLTLDGGRLALVVGEVQGDGLPAALFLAQLATAFRLACRAGDDPGRALALANTQLVGQDERPCSATAAVVLCRPAEGRLALACAGRAHPLLVLRAGRAEWLQVSQGGSLGRLADLAFPTAQAALAAGETALLVSDGVATAANAAGERFGEDRLVRAALGAAGRPPEGVVDAVARALAAHLGGEPEQDLVLIAWRSTSA